MKASVVWNRVFIYIGIVVLFFGFQNCSNKFNIEKLDQNSKPSEASSQVLDNQNQQQDPKYDFKILSENVQISKALGENLVFDLDIYDEINSVSFVDYVDKNNVEFKVEWFKDDAVMENATPFSLQLNNIVEENIGTYKVKVTYRDQTLTANVLVLSKALAAADETTENMGSSESNESSSQMNANDTENNGNSSSTSDSVVTEEEQGETDSATDSEQMVDSGTSESSGGSSSASNSSGTNSASNSSGSNSSSSSSGSSLETSQTSNQQTSPKTCAANFVRIDNECVSVDSITAYLSIRPSYTVEEGKSATFTFNLSRAIPIETSFRVQTRNGSALANTDYVAKNVIVKIPAGKTSAKVSVSAKNNSYFSNCSKSFILSFSRPTVGLEIATTTTKVMISDDERPPSSSCTPVINQNKAVCGRTGAPFEFGYTFTAKATDDRNRLVRSASVSVAPKSAHRTVTLTGLIGSIGFSTHTDFTKTCSK